MSGLVHAEHLDHLLGSCPCVIIEEALESDKDRDDPAPPLHHHPGRDGGIDPARDQGDEASLHPQGEAACPLDHLGVQVAVVLADLDMESRSGWSRSTSRCGNSPRTRFPSSTAFSCEVKGWVPTLLIRIPKVRRPSTPRFLQRSRRLSFRFPKAAPGHGGEGNDAKDPPEPLPVYRTLDPDPPALGPYPAPGEDVPDIPREGLLPLAPDGVRLQEYLRVAYQPEIGHGDREFARLGIAPLSLWLFPLP